METRADANDSKKDGLFMPGKKEGWQQQTAGKGNEKRERGMILVDGTCGSEDKPCGVLDGYSRDETRREMDRQIGKKN
ncbi:hypothetical protein QE152_g25703 [Popillia japonica]|uniref:Uncharacterized protein n=1 Tax=Popillia japonica TaxID=7064 RepID=A0AAW1K112_POPJA